MWIKASKEVLDKAQYIVPLKKGELQVEYAKALVKIDKAIEYIENNVYYSVNSGKVSLNLENDDYYDLLQILEDKEADINVGEV